LEKAIPKAAPQGQIFEQAVVKKAKVIKSKTLGAFEESSGYLPMRLPYFSSAAADPSTSSIISSKEPMLLQMPCSLPFKQVQQMQKMGKLRFMKSGKVILRIGEVDLDVSKGIETTFYQELVKIQGGQIDFVTPIK
jgi:hypothetical protein